MNGILIVDKPKGITSRDVCNKVEHALHIKGVGHTGTLDPLATGVLVVLLGKCTKLSNSLENQTKTYICDLTLGIETDTYDILGKVLEEKDVNSTKEEVVNALEELSNQTEQTPPIYSAIKVNGKKLYDYALDNINIDIKKRPVKIDLLELIEYLPTENKKINLKLKIKANKGFYVRSLVHDLGEILKTGATMTDLRRIQAGNYSIEDSTKLDDLTIELANEKLISSAKIFEDLPSFELNDFYYKLVKNGVILDTRNYPKLERFKAMYKGSLIAVFEPNEDNKTFKMIYREVE